MFILGIIDNSKGPIYPELLEYFNLTKKQGSLIFSVSSFISFLTVLFNRFWLYRFGPLKSAKFALIFHVISCILMASASGTQLGFTQFLFGCSIFGVAIGVQSICLNIILRQNTGLAKRRKTLSGFHSMYGISSFIGPFLIGFLYQLGVSWQFYFISLGILPFLVLFYGRNLGKLERAPQVKKAKISNKETFLFGTMLSLYVASEVLISSRLVVYLNLAKGWTLADASFHLSLFFLGLLLGRLVFAFKEFKINSVILMRSSLIGSLCVMAIGAPFYEETLFLTGFTTSYFFPAAMDYIFEKFGERGDTIISKIMIFIGGILVFMHSIFSWVAEAWGLEAAIYISPVMMAIVLILTFVTERIKLENSKETV